MTIFKKAIPRRTFLKGAGATLALPLLDSMIPAFAKAADPALKPPARVGFVYVPNGINMSKWTPATEGTDFEMNPILQPLAPFRDRLLVLTGLDQNPATALPGEGGAFHTRTTVAWLTGVHPKATKGGDILAGVSVDQAAAKEFGKQTQLSSLELALDAAEAAGVCEGEYTCAYANTLCWRTPTTPLPMENKPRAVFERLFGDNESTDAAARLTRIRENHSILDSLTREIARLQTKLHSKDHEKLSEFLDAIRDIERRIQIAEAQSSLELPTLERPDAAPAAFEEYAKLMFDLEVLAFQTDLTRVATFRMGRESSGRTFPEIGVSEGHHSVSHHRGDPRQMEKGAKIDTYHVKLFSHLVEKLRATPDGDGNLLDHVMIVYGAGMSDGNMHTNQSLPVLLVGGAGGKIKGGRHLVYPKGTPMTNLYLSMLDTLGIRTDKLGDSTGKLELPFA